MACLIALLGISASFFVWLALWARQNQIAQVDFAALGSAKASVIQRELQSYTNLMITLAAFYDASSEVDSDKFATFCRPLIASRKGLQSIEWLPKVLDANRPEFEKELESSSGVPYGIAEVDSRHELRTARQRPQYFPVRYLVEPSSSVTSALGFDHASDADRWLAMETAMETGSPAASSLLTLIQRVDDTKARHGILLAVPVYQKGTCSKSSAERRTNLTGFFVSIVQINNVLGESLTDFSRERLDTTLRDSASERLLSKLGSVQQLNSLSFASLKSLLANPSITPVALPIRCAQQMWSVSFSPSESYIASQRTWLPVCFLFTGIISTFSIANYIRLLSKHQVEIELKVEQRTAELQISNRELRVVRNKLEHMVRHDHLTGLLNRFALGEELERLWEQANATSSPLACTIIDIDYFKQINDTYGHAAGDEVIVAVAAAIKAACRKQDRVARHGGEEFCVILPGLTEGQAIQWIDRVRIEIDQLKVASVIAGVDLNVAVSCGVAERSSDRTPDSLMARADEALFAAKQRGRNLVIGFGNASQNPERSLAHGRLPIGPTASQLMTPPACCLKQTDSVVKAIELLIQTRVESLPVINEAGELVGLIGEEDLSISLLTSKDWHGSVGEHIRRKPVVFDPQTPVELIASFFERAPLRRVAIVEAGKPVGMISRSVLLRWYGLAHAVQQANADGHHAFELLAQTLDQLVEVSHGLKAGLRNPEGDTSTQIIVSTVKMQELIEQLLEHPSVSGERNQGQVATLSHMFV